MSESSNARGCRSQDTASGEGEERGKERDKGKGKGEREIRGNVTKGKRGERERREGE